MVWFWIFMMVMNLLISFTMIGFGKYFTKGGPKDVNGVFGYRTSMSMKNKETWEFAHRYCGRLWLVLGTVMLIVSIISMCFVIGKEIDVIGTFGAIVCGVQLVFLVGSIFPTEIALKKEFDKEGNRKQA